MSSVTRERMSTLYAVLQKLKDRRVLLPKVVREAAATCANRWLDVEERGIFGRLKWFLLGR